MLKMFEELNFYDILDKYIIWILYEEYVPQRNENSFSFM